jgi:hypothetical protein
MKKNKVFFGLLAGVTLLVSSLVFTGCPDTNNPDNGGDGAGTLNLTISGATDGQFVLVYGPNSDQTELMLGGDSKPSGVLDNQGHPTTLSAKAVKISGGKATLKMYSAPLPEGGGTLSVSAYKGDDTMSLSVFVYTTTDITADNFDSYVLGAGLLNQAFVKGCAEANVTVETP